jgi:predicted phage-related endonuclease
MPRLENLRQNSTDWRDWRRGGLGSSDAPVVMGNSPWMMPRKLWEIKTHRTEEPDRDNIATRRASTRSGGAGGLRTRDRRNYGAALHVA